MPVPRASVLAPGVTVNIVLKADQSSGKLTVGKIQDLLSKGDHPRGIKVRLQDGQIGRVQSLVTGGSNGNIPPPPPGTRQQYKIQDDYRNDPQPSDKGLSLSEYIKTRSTKKVRGKKQTGQRDDAPKPETDSQAMLETEFPIIDSSLIAAILGDSEDIGSARSVLKALAPNA